MFTKFRRVAIALLAATGVAVTAPAAANATARGYESWGATPFSAKGVIIPKGQLYHEIVGKGLNIKTDGVNAGARQHWTNKVAWERGSISVRSRSPKASA